MKREIFEVTAKIVDANGTYNTLSGYPKTFDSKNYDNDIMKTQQRAYGEYHTALGSFGTRDDRQIQIAMVTRISDGMQIAKEYVGELAELPDPEPEPEEEQE